MRLNISPFRVSALFRVLICIRVTLYSCVRDCKVGQSKAREIRRGVYVVFLIYTMMMLYVSFVLK